MRDESEPGRDEMTTDTLFDQIAGTSIDFGPEVKIVRAQPDTRPQPVEATPEAIVAAMKAIEEAPQKMTAADVAANPIYKMVAETYCDEYKGNFAFMVDMVAAKTRWGTLTDPQAAGVLNCWRAEVRRNKEQAAQKANPTPKVTVPSGRYAIENEDGVLRFYKVNTPEKGKWAGYTFVDVMASDESYAIRNRTERERIIAEIAKDPKAAMQRYGWEIGKCGVCGRTLTDEESRRLGIGPVCAERF